MVVERHAGRDDVDHREALVHQSRLDQRHELLLVAREAARNERASERQRGEARIHRRLQVLLALLRFRADVGRRRELALGEAVDAVVLAARRACSRCGASACAELAEPIESESPSPETPIIVSDRLVRGDPAPVSDRRHAAVDAVEAVRARWRNRPASSTSSRCRTAWPGVMRARGSSSTATPDDRGRDRVVAAPRAERRHREPS